MKPRGGDADVVGRREGVGHELVVDDAPAGNIATASAPTLPEGTAAVVLTTTAALHSRNMPLTSLSEAFIRRRCSPSARRRSTMETRRRLRRDRRHHGRACRASTGGFATLEADSRTCGRTIRQSTASENLAGDSTRGRRRVAPSAAGSLTAQRQRPRRFAEPARACAASADRPRRPVSGAECSARGCDMKERRRRSRSRSAIAFCGCCAGLGAVCRTAR